MKNEKKCGSDWTQRTRIVGAVFIVLATVLTLLTLNGLGILGMFAVGCMMCHCKSSHCSCPCCNPNACKDDSSCHEECSESTTKHKKKED